MFKKGDKVQHRRTKRKGTVHSASKKHPGWLKVLWHGEQDPYRYEVEELVHEKED